MKSGNLNFLETSGPLQACNGTDLHSALYLLTPLESRLNKTGTGREGNNDKSLKWGNHPPHPAPNNCTSVKPFITGRDARKQCRDTVQERYHIGTHGEEARWSSLKYQHTCRHTRSTTVCKGTRRTSCGYRAFKKEVTQNKKIIRSYQNISCDRASSI